MFTVIIAICVWFDCGLHVKAKLVIEEYCNRVSGIYQEIWQKQIRNLIREVELAEEKKKGKKKEEKKGKRSTKEEEEEEEEE